MNLRLLATAAIGASLFASSTGYAAVAYALTDSNRLLTFDTAAPSQLNGAFPLRTAANAPIEDLVGIDIRPSNNTLYGVGAFGTIYTINTASGVATPVATLTADGTDASSPFTFLSGSRFGVDFNPVPDRLRIVSDSDQNLRVNVATGATITDGNINPASANIVGAAYTNNDTDAATGTTLYVIDSVTNQLLIQAPPNDGTVTVVGALSLDASSLDGFDITTIGGQNFAFAANQVGMNGISQLYSVNLATGASTLIDTIGGGDLIDGLAVTVPEPTTLGLLAGGLLVAARRRAKA